MTNWMTAAAVALPLWLHAGWAPSRDAPPFAAPEVIVASGGPLLRRVVLADISENLRLMLAMGGRTALQESSLGSRPRIRVAMYWGTQWRGKLDLPDSVTVFAADGAQPGAFYPAFRGQPALWVFGAYGTTPASVRGVAAEGLEILAKHEIPTTVR